MNRLLPAAYAVALVFLLSPFVDVITNVWPMVPGDVQWRFAFFGVTSNYLVSALFGAILLALAAAAAEHRGVLLASAIMSALIAVLLLLGALLYGLDVLQLRSNVRPEAMFAFKVGAAKSLFKLIISAVAFAMVALGSRRAWKDLRHSRRSHSD